MSEPTTATQEPTQAASAPAPCTCGAEPPPATTSAPAPAAPEAAAHVDAREEVRGYVWIWGALVVALLISLAVGGVGTAPGLVGAIFVVAFAKAALVVMYFMHLSHEPRFVKLVVAGALGALLAFYVGVFPDVAGAWSVAAGPAAPAAPAGPEEGPAAARPGDPEAGGRVYQRLCAACHQADGRGRVGTTQLAADFVGDPARLAKPDEDLLRSIREGLRGSIGQMPSWEANTTDQERRDALAFIRARFGARQRRPRRRSCIPGPRGAWSRIPEGAAKPRPRATV